MYIPNPRVATEREELEQVPQSSFGEYLTANVVGAFVDTTTATSALGYEATQAEIEQYKDAASEIEQAEVIEAETLGLYSAQDDRVQIKTLPVMSEDKWKESEYYRKGMRYEPDITEARLKVYAEWFDAKKRREDVIARRDAGFFEGSAGFLAGIVGSIPDPINFVSFGVAPGASTVKRIALAAAENVGAEYVTQLATSSQREAAGIQLTAEEKMINIAFAGLIGGAFGGLGAAFSARKASREASGMKADVAARFEREGVVLRDDAGKMKVDVVDAEPSVKVLTDKAINAMPVKEKTQLMNKLSDSLEKIGEVESQRVRVGVEPNPDVEPQTMSMHEQVMNDIFRGDMESGQSLSKAMGYERADIATTLINNKPINENIPSEPVVEAAARIDQEPIENVQYVSEKDNLPAEEFKKDIDVSDEPLLMGKTLFEVADNDVAKIDEGISKAIQIVNEDGCL